MIFCFFIYDKIFVSYHSIHLLEPTLSVHCAPTRFACVRHARPSETFEAYLVPCGYFVVVVLLCFYRRRLKGVNDSKK